MIIFEDINGYVSQIYLGKKYLENPIFSSIFVNNIYLSHVFSGVSHRSCTEHKEGGATCNLVL